MFKVLNAVDSCRLAQLENPSESDKAKSAEGSKEILVASSDVMETGKNARSVGDELFRFSEETKGALCEAEVVATVSNGSIEGP